MRNDPLLSCLLDPASETLVQLRAVLATGGIRLVVRPPLRTARRRLLGAWDPALRRIELFLDPQTKDSPTKTLAHELGHALAPDPRDESAARAFADRWLSLIPESRIAAWDEALKAEATAIEKPLLAAHDRDDRVWPP